MIIMLNWINNYKGEGRLPLFITLITKLACLLKTVEIGAGIKQYSEEKNVLGLFFLPLFG